MRALGALLPVSVLLAGPAYADPLSISICDAYTIDVIQDALELQGYTLLDPTASCIDAVAVIHAADQGPGYTAELMPAWWSADVEVSVTDPTARAAVQSAIIVEGRVPPSGLSIIHFTETYDVGPLPIK